MRSFTVRGSSDPSRNHWQKSQSNQENNKKSSLASAKLHLIEKEVQLVASAAGVKPAQRNSAEQVLRVPESISMKEQPAERLNIKRYTSIMSGSSRTNPVEKSRTEICESEAPEHEKDSDQLADTDADVPESRMSQLVSSIIEDDNFEMKINTVRPIVEMPKSLSSRISGAAVQQPVVVLPLKATVRPGLSVNFGVNHLQQQQQPSQLQRPFDDVVTSVKQVSPRYTSTSVEAALLSSPRVDQTAEAAAVIRRGQVIQRPGQSLQRDAYMTPPPGLASENNSTLDMSTSYVKGPGTAGRYNNFANYGHEESADSAPGFPQYYGHNLRSPYQQHHGAPSISAGSSYSRSIEFSNKPTLEQSRPSHQTFGAPWATYSTQHGNHYPNIHYSQHYPDPSSYHAQTQQQNYGMPSGARYTPQSGPSYSNVHNGYTPTNFYGANEASGRTAHSQGPRQTFPDAFAPSKNL